MRCSIADPVVVDVSVIETSRVNRCCCTVVARRSASRRLGDWLALSAVALIAACLFGQSANAANYTWEGTAGTAWSTGGNWLNGATPPTGSVVLFDSGSYTHQPTFNVTSSAAAVWDTGSGSVTITGSIYNLGFSDATINGNSNIGIEMDGLAGNLTIAAPLILNNISEQEWLNNSSSLLTVSGNVDFNNNGPLLVISGSGNTLISGDLVGEGGLTKAGNGLLNVSGSNSYTGATSVNQGELQVNGSLASLITVNSGGMLAGTGSLTSVTVNPGGIFAPGDAPGIMNLSGNLSLLLGARMHYRLDIPVDSDQVIMASGMLSLDGQQLSDFNFEPLGGFGPGVYTLIDADSVTGVLGSDTTGTIDGQPVSLAVFNNELVLNVAPEPGTLTLLAVCAVGMVFRYRRLESQRDSVD